MACTRDVEHPSDSRVASREDVLTIEMRLLNGVDLTWRIVSEVSFGRGGRLSWRNCDCDWVQSAYSVKWVTLSWHTVG